MKAKLIKFFMKASTVVNCLALLLVVQGANNTCAWVIHQPEFPEEANKYRRVK